MQVFPIPKKIIGKVETFCRNFLWSAKAEGRKAYVAWETLCEPKNVGGLNIKDLNMWNKTMMMKLLWISI